MVESPRSLLGAGAICANWLGRELPKQNTRGSVIDPLLQTPASRECPQDPNLRFGLNPSNKRYRYKTMEDIRMHFPRFSERPCPGAATKVRIREKRLDCIMKAHTPCFCALPGDAVPPYPGKVAEGDPNALCPKNFLFKPESF